MGLALQPAARRDLVDVAVNVDLQQRAPDDRLDVRSLLESHRQSAKTRAKRPTKQPVDLIDDDHSRHDKHDKRARARSGAE